MTMALKNREAKIIKTAKPVTATTIEIANKIKARPRTIGNHIGKKSIFKINSNIKYPYLRIIFTGRYSTVL